VLVASLRPHSTLTAPADCGRLTKVWWYGVDPNLREGERKVASPKKAVCKITSAIQNSDYLQKGLSRRLHLAPSNHHVLVKVGCRPGGSFGALVRSHATWQGTDAVIDPGPNRRAKSKKIAAGCSLRHFPSTRHVRAERFSAPAASLSPRLNEMTEIARPPRTRGFRFRFPFPAVPDPDRMNFPRVRPRH